MNTVTTRRFTHTQLVLVLCAGLVALAGCSDNAANPVISQEQIRKHGIADGTYYRWKPNAVAWT